MTPPLIAANDPTWFAAPLDEREKSVVGKYWSWSGPAARKVTLAADRGISGFGITPSGGKWRLSGGFLFARFDTGEVLFSRMSPTGNFYGDMPLRKADLPVLPRKSAEAIRTSIMPRLRFKTVSFYMDNARQAAEGQKTVFDKLGLEIEQVKTCVAHGIAIDDYLASRRDLDCVLLFDVDCIPLHRDAVPTLLANAADDRVVGVAAQSNHLNANHPYAQASCVAVPMRLWEGMGMPSLRGSCHVEGAANRSDTAEDFTWAAEEDGVPIALLWPCHVEEPKHRLGLDRMFGYGTSYAAADGVPLLYHAGECRFGAGRFVKKCQEVLGNAAGKAATSVQVGDTPPMFDYPEFYEKMAKDAPDGAVMVEVGCWLGESVLHLASLGRKLDKRLKIYAVDMWSGAVNYRREESPKTDPSFLGRFKDNVGKAGLSDAVIPIVGDSVSAANSFGDGAVHMAFIDGSHDYGSAATDIRAWLPKVAKGGFIAGHDYFWSPEVKRAVDEILGKVETCGTCWFKIVGGAAPPAPALRRMPMTRIISAKYESDAGSVDATPTASALMGKADFFCVGSAFGDPFPGRKKTLRVRYEFGGRELDDSVGEWGMFVPRHLRADGVPGGKEGFEIEWAKYGGERLVDFTEEARKYYADPFSYCSIFDHKTEPKTKGYAWEDPHPGIPKHYVVKFHYHGRTYVSTMRDPCTRQRLLSPVFSVVIPTWNRAPFLRRCIDSVLAQDFDPSLVETVVVDDGSTDDTSRVMAEICMEHPRVSYVRVPHIGCCGLVRNLGVAVSSGTYIAYLDSDDKFKPRHLSAAFERFQVSRAFLLRTWSDFCTLKIEDGGIRETMEEDFNHRLYGKYAVYPSCIVHRRDILDELGCQAPFIAREGEDVWFAAAARALETSMGIPEEVVEEKTMTYGLIIGGDNLTYERPEVAAAYRDRK